MSNNRLEGDVEQEQILALHGTEQRRLGLNRYLVAVLIQYHREAGHYGKRLAQEETRQDCKTVIVARKTVNATSRVEDDGLQTAKSEATTNEENAHIL